MKKRSNWFGYAVLLCGMLGLPGGPVLGQLEDVLIEKAIEKASEEIPKILLGDEDFEDPGGPSDTTMDWTAIWRSSEAMGGARSMRTGPDDWEARPKGKRIGCICMDGTEQDKRGRGACSGHGGVRYWRYETPEGEEMTHPTSRHYRHPDPMTNDEKLSLAAYNEPKEGPAKRGLGGQLDSFVNLAIVLASTTMVVYYMRAILLQRPKKRRRKPAGGKGGAGAV